jgi:hypothetical protein
MGKEQKREPKSRVENHDTETAAELTPSTVNPVNDSRGRQAEGNVENHDTETAAELTPSTVNPVDDSRERQTEVNEVNGTGIGVTALILSLLAFFMFPFILAATAIVLGIVGARRGSAAGWWAVGIGAFVLIIRILAFPILAIF